MTTIDTAALKDLGKTVSGRDGLYWDFYRVYLISGIVFNKEKFKNLPNRSSGAPLEITEGNRADQGVTIVEILEKGQVIRASGRIFTKSM